MTQVADAGYIGEALLLSERDIARTFAKALLLADVVPEQPELRLELASGTLININVEEVRERALIEGVIFLETRHNSYRLRGETRADSIGLYSKLNKHMRDVWAYIQRR